VLRRADEIGGRAFGRRPGEAAASAIGIASAAWPMTSEAAAAISSAKPVSVTSSVRPNMSLCPRQSIAAGQPRRADRDPDRPSPPTAGQSCR